MCNLQGTVSRKEVFGPKKRGGIFKLSVVLPLLAVAVLATASAVLFAGRAVPLLAAERAFVNLGGDMATRLNGSPLGAWSMLGDALVDGVVGVSFDFSDRWSSVSFDAQFHSDDANREYMLLLDMEVDGTAFDLEAHLNRHRIAASSSLIDDIFLSANFDTFREDFQQLGGMLGLSDADIDEIADIIDMLSNIMNTPDVGMEAWEPYTELLRQFMLDGALSSERMTIVSGGQDVSVTRSEFHYAPEDIVNLLRELLVMVSLDSNFDPLGMVDPVMWNQIMRDFDGLVMDIDEYVEEGDMYIVAYIGPANRLVRLEVLVDMATIDSALNLFFSADFGMSVFDPWYFTFSSYTESPNWLHSDQIETSAFEVEIVWTYEEVAGRYVNTLDIAGFSSWRNEMLLFENDFSFRIDSEWDSNTGVFVISYEDEWDALSMSGIYRLDSNGGFMLSFDPIDIGWGDASFSFEISAQIGHGIRPVQDYINISELTLGMLIDLFLDFLDLPF